MFWADTILEKRTGKEIVNDAWTPSGIVHMGGLKGPVIHDTLYRIQKGKAPETVYMFGFDDMDPIDGLPPDLQGKLGEYMGVPICNAPSPEGQGTFGEYYGAKMRTLFKELDIKADIYLASDYYRKGIYDEAIRYVLDNADKIRKVYSEMYGKDIPSDWFPFQVICPECGKLGTTKVTGWNGDQVTYSCEPSLVAWAKGCGNSGELSPFGGNGKMPFKVEWAAKWWTFKITIEGAGKDHASAGGTYDVARKIVKDVFDREPPLKLPYEFFLYDGKKMSSSKGLGLTGEELLEVLPPELVRFLMIKNEPNHAVEFNPYNPQIIPRLYEEYQRAAKSFVEKKGDDYARSFELSQIHEPEDIPTGSFSSLIQYVQMPGSEAQIEKEGLERWKEFARVFVEKYLPESDRLIVQESLPDRVTELTDEQKTFLKELASKIDLSKNADDIQSDIFNLIKAAGLKPGTGFQAIYKAFLGNDHGPRVGMLFSSLENDFVQRRLEEASR